MIQHQMKYVEAYIHFRKKRFIRVMYPASLEHRNLLERAYNFAIAYMKSIGKVLTPR